ncbi:MAG TPA: BON domain-containing protein [Chloroflexota bacterium]|nr:BON domain-containing protein [Chloroflexota bacterium]
MVRRSLTDASVALVRDAIRQDARFRTSSIEVSTARGAVVLSGLVPDPAARAAAVAIARRTRGVVEVVDRLRVQPFVPRFDADITADVVAAITLDAATNPAQIDVQTVDGVVYLHGLVPDPTIRQMVDSIARSVVGVRDVVDDLGIEPPVSHPDSEILQTLRDRLRQILRPETVDRIHLAVRHGVVYLRGEVETTGLRWAIEDLVRWAPGVIDLVDELHGPAKPMVSRHRR